jgi:hypothetical protein
MCDMKWQYTWNASLNHELKIMKYAIYHYHNLCARTKRAFTFLPEIKFSFVHVKQFDL